MVATLKGLEIGVGILRLLRDIKMSWHQMFSEWVDNSLDAKATIIEITIGGDTLEISDNGHGCPDLFAMESPAKSLHTAHTVAGMFGAGGVMGQINGGNGGRVKVSSNHKKRWSEIEIDWNACIEANQFEPISHIEKAPLPGVPTGTKIQMPKARKIANLERLIEGLGHTYAVKLRKGRVTISFKVDGKIHKVSPFAIPKFVDRVDFEFDYQGHRIKGFFGLLPEGVRNPHPGWSIHWGHRFMMVTKAPAGDRIVNRAYGEIYLPPTWKNVTPTKDDFSSDAEGLWELVGQHCDRIVKLAEDQSVDLEFNEATEIAGEMLMRAITGNKSRIKGERPGSTGKTGAVSPTGTGGEHRNFNTFQPGDKEADGHGLPVSIKMPSRIRITWDETLDAPFAIDVAGTRSRTMTITLSKAYPQLHEFKTDPSKLATLCCGFVAEKLSNDQRFEGMFPSFRGENYPEILGILLNRVGASAATESRVAI